jgi:serine-type D-Ala-D-Ala carboxypeptidase/endopeptidase (penicillin-binding protein 4)
MMAYSWMCASRAASRPVPAVRVWHVKHLLRGPVVTNRLRRTALIALALLNAFTLSAGVAVASVLPGRLALWRVPRVTSAPLAPAGPVLAPARAAGSAPTARGLALALDPLFASGSLGPNPGGIVTDLSTGSVLFSRQPASWFAPASSAKLLTAVAALSVLGPGARLRTTVVRGAPGSIILVGGGDPTLAAGAQPRADYPRAATLASLAASTARWLRAHGQRSVRLGYDASLFTGPRLATGWTYGYVSTGNVSPITALEVDQGRLTPAGRPQDADVPGNFHPRSPDPTGDTVAAFAAFLRARGIRVLGTPRPARAAPRAVPIAAVQSPLLSAIVGWMLRESNNVIAEDLARHVALRTGRPASFAGGSAAVMAVLRRLGIGRGVYLADGSGLSTKDGVSPQALAATVRVAAVGHPSLTPVITGMPVAGFSGTLAPGQSVFGNFGPPALGMVRAKTGNLSTVASLAGIVNDRSGHLLVFAFMSDQVVPGQLPDTARMIDAMATVLAGCGCR